VIRGLDGLQPRGGSCGPGSASRHGCGRQGWEGEGGASGTSKNSSSG
jgi:hypothetical protein